MKKTSRETRLEVLILWFNQLRNGDSTEESIQKNKEYTGYFLFEKELAKIEEKPEKLPLSEDEWSEFKEFLNKFGFIQVPKYSRGGGEKKGPQLPTTEKALEIGVAETDVPTYVNAMKNIYLLKAEAEAVMGGRKIAISIPNRTKKEVNTPVE